MKCVSKRLFTVLVIVLYCFMALGSTESSEQEVKTITKDTETIEETKEETLIATIEEQLLFDYKGIKVTAKEITEDWLGPQLKVLIENETNQNITISLDAIAVNDYMVSAWLYESVASGKKSNATFDIYSSTLETAGISNIGKIDLYFSVIDSDTYNTIYESDAIELKTSLYDTMDTEVNDVGEEMVNQSGIRIVGKGVNDSIWGLGVLLYIENNTNKNILITTDNLSVNGFMVTGYLYSDVKAGKKAVETILLSSTDLQDNDIECIEKLELSFDVLNADTWGTIFSIHDLSFRVN